MGDPSREFDDLSLDDFEELIADRPDDELWELIGGRLFRRKIGEPWEHARIIRNIGFCLENGFEAKGSSCQSFTETFYMKSRPLEAAMLPDVLVVCGDLEPGATSTDDPVVLFEVLSPGSQDRDRFEKWAIYRQLASLRHYVLVTRDRPFVQVYDRIENDWSGLRERDGLDATLELPAIGASLPLADIYRRVIAA